MKFLDMYKCNICVKYFYTENTQEIIFCPYCGGDNDTEHIEEIEL